MDNFMDRLSGRFHAGELIRANGEAEAKQMQKLKEQSEEQSQVLSEVRRLNLKTVEISEQVSQMAALSIERLEEFEEILKENAEALKNGQQEGKSGDLDGGSGWELEIYQGMSQLHTELQNIESLETSLMSFQESQSEHNAKQTTLMNEFLEAQSKPTSWQTEVWQSMSMMQQQLQNLEHLSSSLMTFNEQLQSSQSAYHEKIDERHEAMHRDLGEQARAISEKLDGYLNKDVKPNFVYEIEASLSEIENNAVRGRQETWTKMDLLRSAIPKKSSAIFPSF